MNATDFRRIFNRVCDDFELSPEVRRIACEQCFARATDGGLHTLKNRMVRAYVSLDATRPPYRASYSSG